MTNSRTMITGRVAFVSTMDTGVWGGSEELWSGAAATLRQRGAEVGANVWRWPEPAEKISKLVSLGCQIHFRRTIRRLKPLVGNFFDRRACAWLDNFKPDLVVISMGYHTEGVEWMEACSRRRIPYALIVQSAGEPFWPSDPDAKSLAAGYAGAVATFFVSRGNIDFVRSQIAAPMPDAEVVWNPYNVSYEADPPWPGEEQGYRLACVGRLQPMAKGQDLLFRVLSQDKWKNRPLRVSLYGNGPNRETLVALKEMYALDNVTFSGHDPDIEAIWATHHALILPSRYEGLPLVVVEAMLCGRPCIVTDVAGNAEVIEDNVSGFLAAGANHRLLDDALERAWQRRTEWQEIGRVAARKSRELIPADPVGDFAERIIALFEHT